MLLNSLYEMGKILRYFSNIENGVSFSHIHNGPHHEYGRGVSFSVLREYLKISL